MKDPVRWRDPNGGADAETRALLSSDRGPVPSGDEANRIWAGLETELHLGPVPAHTPLVGPATATTGTGALAGKITLAVVLVAAVGAGVALHGSHSRGRQEGAPVQNTTRAAPSEKARFAGAATAGRVAMVPATESVAAAPTAKPVAAPAASIAREIHSRSGRPAQAKATGNGPAQASPGPAAVEVQEHPQLQAEPMQREDKPMPSSWAPSPLPSPSLAKSSETYPLAQVSIPPEEAPVPVNQLLEESRQLERARAALRAHDPDRALRLLKLGASRTTALAQEREVLTIEALAAKPSLRAKATARARSFIETYPQSPYRARIRAIAFEGE
jgi:hypothetical protein